MTAGSFAACPGISSVCVFFTNFGVSGGDHRRAHSIARETFVSRKQLGCGAPPPPLLPPQSLTDEQVRKRLSRMSKTKKEDTKSGGGGAGGGAAGAGRERKV